MWRVGGKRWVGDKVQEMINKVKGDKPVNRQIKIMAIKDKGGEVIVRCR